MSTDNKLFVVYLGGTAPRANTELHDVVFAAERPRRKYSCDLAARAASLWSCKK